MQRLVQLALDLFDPPPAAAPAPLAPAVGVPDTKQKMPSAPDGQALVAPKTIVNRPAAPAVLLPSLLSPAEFRHPQANRELLLGDAVVAYALLRARRRSIGFTVGADGLSVRAPSWVTLGAVDSALREKSDWILRKLAEARERQQRMEGGRIVWADGAVLPYLGEPLTVVLDPSHGFAGKGGALVAAALLVLWRYHHVAVREFGGITGDLAGWFLQKAEFWMLAALAASQWGGIL